MHSQPSEIPAEVESDEMVLREVEWGDMNVGFETFDDRLETDELFADLPDGRCQSPHWGYVLDGRMTIRYADDEETIDAGEVYYMEPGHNVTIEAGTTVVEFSPREKYQETLDAAERGVQ